MSTDLQQAVYGLLTSFLDANLKWMADLAGDNWSQLNAESMTGEQIHAWINAYGHLFDSEIYSDLELTLGKADDYVTFFRGVSEIEELFLRVVDFRQGLLRFSQFLADIDLDSLICR